MVLSATMGSGHDAVAGVLTDRLTALGHDVDRIDVLGLLPAGLGPALRSFYRLTIKHLPAVYAGIYSVFFQDGTDPRPGSTPLASLAARALLPVAGLMSSCRCSIWRPRRPANCAAVGRYRFPALWW
jgi:hypothetical protein